jgi:hypothetical protein
MNVDAVNLERAAAALERSALDGAVNPQQVESLHSAWRDLQRHPRLLPYVNKGHQVA